jgi:hypothetical protein
MTNDRFYPSRPVLAASVALFHEGRILLAARGKPPSEGLFSLPGGMVEVGESLAEAAESIVRKSGSGFPHDALFQERSIGWIPKVQIHFWVRCFDGNFARRWGLRPSLSA